MFSSIKRIRQISFLMSSNFSSKIINDPHQIIKQIPEGATILVGGFGLCGIPTHLINSLHKVGTKNLTIISNNCGTEDQGLGILLKNKQIKQIIASYAGENHELTRYNFPVYFKLSLRKYFRGEIELELIPQGTLAEKIRSGGAGIPAFYTPTGIGTIVESGGYPLKFLKGGISVEKTTRPKQVEIFNGRRYLREEAIFGEYALIKASKADTKGNLIFNKTARNFNQDMVRAAKKSIVEVEEIVPAGEIPPDNVHVSGIYVDYIYKGEKYDKTIEKVLYDQETYDQFPDKYEQPENQKVKNNIARRGALELVSGMYVNLGIGIPNLVPAFIDPQVDVQIHSEIGVFGVGKYPKPGKEDPDLVNAGKEAITLQPGSSIFSSSVSFSMIRGGHIDLTILGALQVSKHGDIANWMIPGQMLKGIGGSMDLVSSGSKVLVLMEHTSQGQIKLLESCTYPLTGVGRVDKVITDKAVFEKINGELILTEISKETTLDEVRSLTGFEIRTQDRLKVF